MDDFTFLIYQKMFPGKEKLPAFSSINNSRFCVDIDVERLLADYVVNNSIDLASIEINDFLKLFKKFNYTIAIQFINGAIDYYFSHPEVLSSLQGDRVPLFPNYKSLPDIDYDLLIPVIELE